MFSFTIAIVAIALIVGLLIIGSHLSSGVFNQGSKVVEASRLINEGQQLFSARTFANVNGDLADGLTIAGLAPKYLAHVPANWTTDSLVPGALIDFVRDQDGNPTGVRRTPTFINPNVSKEICQEINVRAGVTARNTASSTDSDDDLVVAAEDLFQKNYGCVTVLTAERPYPYVRFKSFIN